MLKIRLYEILHLIPFFVAFVFFVATRPFPAASTRDETRIPLRRATEDKLIRAKGLMGCSFRHFVLSHSISSATRARTIIITMPDSHWINDPATA